MKFVVAGSRTIKEAAALDELIKLRTSGTHPFCNATEIVCGLAKGSDMAGKIYGNFYDIPVIPFEPDYERYGRYRAPRIRNSKMAAYGDALVLIWDGSSGGSLHMKECMLILEKPVYEIILENEDEA